MKKFRLLCLIIIFIISFVGCAFANEQNINSQNILQHLNGTYSVDYQVRGRYLDSLQKAYGHEISINDNRLNGWPLSIENIIQSSNTEYIITCTYLLKGTSSPPPMIEAKLFVYLSDEGNIHKIEHKSFHAVRWPNGEWKTNMIFYKQ